MRKTNPAYTPSTESQRQQETYDRNIANLGNYTQRRQAYLQNAPANLQLLLDAKRRKTAQLRGTSMPGHSSVRMRTLPEC